MESHSSRRASLTVGMLELLEAGEVNADVQPPAGTCRCLMSCPNPSTASHLRLGAGDGKRAEDCLLVLHALVTSLKSLKVSEHTHQRDPS